MTSDTTVGTELRVQCSRDELGEKRALVSRAGSARSSVQILPGILPRGGNGQLELSATDMELSLRTRLTAGVEGDGAVVVPGRLLVELVRLLPAGEVALEHRAEESALHVASGSAEYRLRTYAVEDFPRLPDVEGAALHTVASGPLHAADCPVRRRRATGRDGSGDLAASPPLRGRRAHHLGSDAGRWRVARDAAGRLHR